MASPAARQARTKTGIEIIDFLENQKVKLKANPTTKAKNKNNS